MPVHGASSVRFVDTDLEAGELGGVVTIVAATNESDVLGYAVYWGLVNGSRAGGMVTGSSVPKAGELATLTLVVPANTPAPPNVAQVQMMLPA